MDNIINLQSCVAENMYMLRKDDVLPPKAGNLVIEFPFYRPDGTMALMEVWKGDGGIDRMQVAFDHFRLMLEGKDNQFFFFSVKKTELKQRMKLFHFTSKPPSSYQLQNPGRYPHITTRFVHAGSGL